MDHLTLILITTQSRITHLKDEKAELRNINVTHLRSPRSQVSEQDLKILSKSFQYPVPSSCVKI